VTGDSLTLIYVNLLCRGHVIMALWKMSDEFLKSSAYDKSFVYNDASFRDSTSDRHVM
jgi:hypothetical protein